MNFEILKMGFKAYLEEHGKIDESNSSLADSEISIFMYANEFKEYLGEKLTGNSEEIQSKSISDIMKMEFTSDGKLINPEDISDYEEALKNGSSSEETGEETEITGEEAGSEAGVNASNGMDMFTNVFNELLQDETFKGTIDADGSGDVNDDELSSFLDIIKGFDDNEDDVSIDDLLTAAQKINDGEFNIEEAIEEEKAPEETTVEEEAPAAAASNNASAPASTGGVSGSGGAGGYNAGNNGSYNSDGVQEKTLENMTKEELNNELTKANDELKTKQDALSAILDGTDATIKGLQEAVDSAYETWQEQLKEVDEELAKKVDDLKQKIDDKENEIDDKEGEISNKENEVSSNESAFNDAKTRVNSLETLLAQLESSNSSEEDNSNEIAAVKSQLEKAKQDRDKAEEALNKSKDELQTLKDEKKELEEGAGGLNELNGQMDELQAEIAEKYPEVKEAQDAYNTAKETYDTEKSKAIDTAKTDISTAQDYVNEVKSAISDYENREVESQYSSTSLSKDMAAKLDAKLGPGFSSKLSEICKKLNCEPEDLLKVMCSESGLNPGAVNGGSGATGLIQFMPSTAQALGTSTSALRNMSATQQLDYVEKYMMQWKGNSNEKMDAGTLYTMVFLPAYANYAPDQTMCARGSAYYDSNSGLDANKDGRITKSDLTNWLNNRIDLNKYV